MIVREADFEHELETLIRVFDTTFNMQSTPERFRWLYEENPDGRAVTWFVIDEQSGAPAGCTAVFPRRVRLAGHTRCTVAWNCGDFAILKKYRTMGAAVKLRRAARDAIDLGKAAFLYAHPNDRMLAVHVRAGHAVIGHMVRYARPLRLTTGVPVVNRLSAPVLRLWRRPRAVSRLNVDLLPADQLPADIDAIDEATAGVFGTSVVRDRQYLQWRFGRNPLERSSVLLVRDRGCPLGFLVFTMKGNVAFVKDWLAVTEPARDELFIVLLDELWRRGAASASVTALETHRDLAALGRIGFVRRPESSAVVTYAAPSSAASESVTDCSRWYMTVGDRDI